MDDYLYTLIPIMADPKGMPDTDFAYIADWIHFDEEKHSLMIMECNTKTFQEQMMQEILLEQKKKWESKKKPVYMPTEKIVLKTLRRAKKLASENYQKPLKKQIAESLLGMELEGMMPYYCISNGGHISDEVEYFPLESVENETNEFRTEVMNEESLLEEMPNLLKSQVIGHTINGDSILLEPGQNVLRYDHEDPMLSIRWNTIMEFFFNNIEIQ